MKCGAHKMRCKCINIQQTTLTPFIVLSAELNTLMLMRQKKMCHKICRLMSPSLILLSGEEKGEKTGQANGEL